MPRRKLAVNHDGIAPRLLLAVAELAQPWCRALSRWMHGGPAPRFAARTAKPARKAYRDDLRATVETSYLGSNGVGRENLLAILQQHGWRPCKETAAWDLESSPCHILTANEKHGPHHLLVKIRLLHPLGMRREGLLEIDRAALEAGLQRV
jgi:hypothetical protein